MSRPRCTLTITPMSTTMSLTICHPTPSFQIYLVSGPVGLSIDYQLLSWSKEIHWFKQWLGSVASPYVLHLPGLLLVLPKSSAKAMSFCVLCFITTPPHRSLPEDGTPVESPLVWNIPPGTPHIMELPYMWGMPFIRHNPEVRNQTEMHDWLRYTEEDDIYADFMVKLWTNFAKYG